MKKPMTMKPPKQLSREAKDIWRKFTEQWDLDDSKLAILQQGLEAFDRMRQAQAVIAKEGIVTTDRFGQAKQHPATLVERDSRGAYLRAIKQLDLSNLPRQGGDDDEDIVAKMVRATCFD